jgi:tripartite-type tricarboxylate transporter receptor subunit TctC
MRALPGDSSTMPTRASVRRLGAAVIALACASVPIANAGNEAPYPARTIRILVPTAPGGAGDTLARYMGERLGLSLRVPVVVENRPGAGGLIGTEIAARAPADGYTILFGATPTHVLAPLLVRATFDPLRDFVAVFNAAYTTSVLVVNDRVPATTVGELVTYAKSRPGVLNYASSGVGSANHIDTEVFMDVAGLQLVHVPYRGTADGYRALAADEVQVMFGAVTSALPAITAGKARPLAVLTTMRSPMLPHVPTLAEAGLRDVDVRKWQGFLVPAGTRGEIVAMLNATFEKIVREPAVREWIERQGYEVAGGSPESFARYLAKDEHKWRTITDRLGLTAK